MAPINRFHKYAHIAHDCKVADRTTIGSLAMIGGHVHIQSDAYIAEKVGVHQFSTIGCHSYVAGQSKIVQDVPCYMRVSGNPSSIRGINGRVLLKRGLTGEARAALRAAHQLIFLARMTLGQASEILELHHHLTPEVIDLLKFLDAQHQGRLGRACEPPARSLTGVRRVEAIRPGARIRTDPTRQRRPRRTSRHVNAPLGCAF